MRYSIKITDNVRLLPTAMLADGAIVRDYVASVYCLLIGKQDHESVFHDGWVHLTHPTKRTSAGFIPYREMVTLTEDIYGQCLDWSNDQDRRKLLQLQMDVLLKDKHILTTAPWGMED